MTRAEWRTERGRRPWGIALATAGLSGVLLLAAACGDGDGASGARWQGDMDTLAVGRVVVRNPATGIWDSTTAWRLVEDLRIGRVEGDGPDLFGSVAGMDVDALGRIWVLDRHAREVRVFGADGAHLRTLGREGGGPGEFRDPIGIAVNGAGLVWVADPGNARYAVFDTAGTYRTSHPRQIGGYSVPWRGGFDDQGHLIEAANARIGDDDRTALIRHDDDVVPVDTIPLPAYDGAVYTLTVRGGSMTAEVPYAPTLVWAFDPGRGIWSGVNGEYRIYEHGFDGDTVREIARVYDPLPVTAAERDTAVARMSWFTEQGGRVDASRIPGHKPAFSRIDVAPDGHLLVSVTRPRGEAGQVFDVFDPEGRYLGELRAAMPLRRGVLFRGDRLYGATTDSLGVTYIVRLRIDAPPGVH